MAKTATRDMIVVLPGITGSVLVDDRGEEIWNASAAALSTYLRSLGASLDKLVVYPDRPDGIRASKLISGIHGVFGLGRIDGYQALQSMIRDNFELTTNYIEFPYDWRLSNRISAQQLKTLIDARLPEWQRSPRGGRNAKVILIAHSMGGLVARYFLEKLEGWVHCRALITFGTPYRGALDAVGYLANGYKKAFLDFTNAMRSMQSVYELLPIWRALYAGNDFARVGETDGLPHIEAARARDALAFHREIEDAVTHHQTVPEYIANRYQIIPVIGVDQPTLQSARFDGAGLSTSRDMPGWIDAPLAGGDGTVPRLSATPIELSDQYRETFFAERHAALQNNPYALDDLRERLKQMQSTNLREIRGAWNADVLAARGAISLDLDPLYLPGEPVRLRARTNGFDTRLTARIQPADAGAPPVELEFSEGPDGPELLLEGLAPGSYRVRVRPQTGGPRAPNPVADVFDVATP